MGWLEQLTHAEAVQLLPCSDTRTIARAEHTRFHWREQRTHPEPVRTVAQRHAYPLAALN